MPVISIPRLGERLLTPAFQIMWSGRPLLSVVPGQLFAGALAHAKGLDADYPVGLSKVTRAR